MKKIVLYFVLIFLSNACLKKKTLISNSGSELKSLTAAFSYEYLTKDEKAKVPVITKFYEFVNENLQDVKIENKIYEDKISGLKDLDIIDWVYLEYYKILKIKEQAEKAAKSLSAQDKEILINMIEADVDDLIAFIEVIFNSAIPIDIQNNNSYICKNTTNPFTLSIQSFMEGELNNGKIVKFKDKNMTPGQLIIQAPFNKFVKSVAHKGLLDKDMLFAEAIEYKKLMKKYYSSTPINTIVKNLKNYEKRTTDILDTLVSREIAEKKLNLWGIKKFFKKLEDKIRPAVKKLAGKAANAATKYLSKKYLGMGEEGAEAIGGMANNIVDGVVNEKPIEISAEQISTGVQAGMDVMGFDTASHKDLFNAITNQSPVSAITWVGKQFERTKPDWANFLKGMLPDSIKDECKNKFGNNCIDSASYLLTLLEPVTNMKFDFSDESKNNNEEHENNNEEHENNNEEQNANNDNYYILPDIENDYLTDGYIADLDNEFDASLALNDNYMGMSFDLLKKRKISDFQEMKTLFSFISSLNYAVINLNKKLGIKTYIPKDIVGQAENKNIEQIAYDYLYDNCINNYESNINLDLETIENITNNCVNKFYKSKLIAIDVNQIKTDIKNNKLIMLRVDWLSKPTRLCKESDSLYILNPFLDINYLTVIDAISKDGHIELTVFNPLLKSIRDEKNQIKPYNISIIKKPINDKYIYEIVGTDIERGLAIKPMTYDKVVVLDSIK